jgi:hypothetical protein
MLANIGDGRNANIPRCTASDPLIRNCINSKLGGGFLPPEH